MFSWCEWGISSLAEQPSLLTVVVLNGCFSNIVFSVCENIFLNVF